MFVSLIKGLVRSGVDMTTDRLIKQRAILTNSLTLATIGFIVVLLGMVVFYGLPNQLIVGFISIAVLMSVFWLNTKGRFSLASLVLINFTSGAIVTASYLAYKANVFADTENWLIGFIAVSVFLFDKRTLAIQFALIFSALILTKYLKFMILEIPLDRDFAILVTNTIVMCSGIYLGLIIVKNALTRSLESLRKSNETKQKLLSIIAHDIKSPLSTFEALLSAGKIGLLDQEDFIKHQDELRERFEPLNDTIESVLSWSSVQADELKPRPSNFDVLECTKKIVKAYEGYANGKGVRVCVTGENQKVNMDEDHFKLILRNLLHNAVKFTPENGSVAIEIKDSNDFVQIEIKDTGIGMSKEIIEKILENHTILSRAGTKGETGTGLGLNVSLELIKANNCQMVISSTVGVGSSFVVNIPSGIS